MRFVMLVLSVLLLCGCEHTPVLLGEVVNASQVFFDDIRSGRDEFVQYYNASPLEEEEAVEIAKEAFLERFMEVQEVSRQVNVRRSFSRQEVASSLEVEEVVSKGDSLCVNIATPLRLASSGKTVFTSPPQSVLVRPNRQGTAFLRKGCVNE
jgi:hypothetical protein